MTLALLVLMREQDPGRDELEDFLDAPPERIQNAERRLLADLGVTT